MSFEVIAEMGINHGGNLVTALRLVDAAVAAGCNAVKTQLWNTERVYPRERWEEMKALELSHDALIALAAHCADCNIELLVTPDEIEDARFLVEHLGVKRLKTSSQDVTNLPFLRQIVMLGKPVIFSTGACSWHELTIAMWQMALEGPAAVLHCVSAYPARVEEMNLRVIDRLRKNYGVPVGLSDHTSGWGVAPLAMALGAQIFEKHLTLDKTQRGPDHRASLEPREMKDYVAVLKRTEEILGDGDKRVMPCEVDNRKKFEEFIKRRVAC